MKVFVAGATGAIGSKLIPLLASSHEVVAMTRSAAKAVSLRATGIKTVVADALDKEAVLAAVLDAQPEVIVHELTAIPQNISFRRLDRDFELTNRLRTEGTDHLVAAARTAGARRIVAQSFAGWTYAREGGKVKTEDDPFDPNPAPEFHHTLDAIRYLERTVLETPDIEGVVLRYGYFYGPGTNIGPNGAVLEAVRQRRLPIVGSGNGVWSFVHVADAASATRLAVERAAAGVYNVADDEPAPVSEWLTALAEAVGAERPRRVPGWLGRIVLGKGGFSMMTENRGASNAKVKRELGWSLEYPRFREGFATLAPEERTRSPAGAVPRTV